MSRFGGCLKLLDCRIGWAFGGPGTTGEVGVWVTCESPSPPPDRTPGGPEAISSPSNPS